MYWIIPLAGACIALCAHLEYREKQREIRRLEEGMRRAHEP